MSDEKAREAVLPGYHGGRAASWSGSAGPKGPRGARSGSSGKKKKTQTTKSVKFQQIGSLLFLLCGMWAHTDAYGNDKVELRSDKPLTGPEEEELRQDGVRLLVDEDATGRPLEFSPDWSTPAIDKWLRTLAPKLFQYLDVTFGVRDGTDDQYHWRLVRQQHKRVFLFGKELVSGTDLGKCMGGQARKKETFRLHIATRQPIDKSVWMNIERAIRVAEKKPVKVDFVDTIERKPHIEDDSSEQDDSSVAGSEFDVEAAMEEAMEEDTSSDEDLWGEPSKPALADKRGAKRTPLFDAEGDSEGVQGGPKASRSVNRSHKELNANGKRRATSPLSPPLYPTRLAKRARRALIESPEPEPEVELEQAEKSDEQKSDEQKSEDAEGPSHTDAFLIDGVDFNVPSSPGGYPFYYSPAPPSPPLLPAAAGPMSHIEPRRPFRESPGRPSKSAWKKRNPS
ncbi:hypothetical protein LXA43DRAFT_1104658 [Ganoderma leucocontextum]|nr:hypothetical protein LXA43DRAFT_1104658 [Ganoderma leucocontextum]